MKQADENRERIRELYAKGMRVKDIASELGYKSSASVSAYINELGIKRRPSSGVHDEIIVRMAREKRTIKEMMAATGLTDRGIYSVMYRLRKIYDFDAKPESEVKEPRRADFSASPDATARALAKLMASRGLVDRT